MATNPLAPAMEPTPAPAPQAGLFDGQMPLPVAPAPAPVNDSMIVQPEPPVQPVPEQPEETQVAGAGPVLRRIFGKGPVDAPRLDIRHRWPVYSYS